MALPAPFDGLEPEAVWAQFNELRKIPRESKHEAKAIDYIVAFAEQHGLEYQTDPAGNCVVRKPATQGRENAPIVVLQGHVDMVCEKTPESDHDFRTDPIPVIREGDWITADGTSLGADNGIGVAAALAVLEADDIEHGPLECLFTVDEETGLTGAFALSSELLKGRIMLNLDSEDWGTLCIGCAGGGGADLTLGLDAAPAPDPSSWSMMKVTVKGLRGGHSGVDAHEQRANATRLLTRTLSALRKDLPLRLVELSGGSKHNAIPRDAHAVVCIPTDLIDSATNIVGSTLAALRSYFRPIDPDLDITFGAAETAGEIAYALDEATTARVLDLLLALPHGVQAYSYDIEDLVETSTNLAIVRLTNDPAALERAGVDAGEQRFILTIHESVRSSVASELDAVRERIIALAALVGADVALKEAYPGWKPDLDSKVLELTTAVYTDRWGTEPKVEAIHAGLECGIIGEKYPGMDMVSFGPEVQNPHSPDERIEIETVAKFYQLLCGLLEQLAAEA